MATKTRKTPATPATTTPAAPALQFISLENIRAEDQVRTFFDEATLQELAESMKQQGMMQPVLLRPDPDKMGSFIIIAGERRVRAAHLAGLTAVPALIGEIDAAKAAEMQLVENIQREDLSVQDLAANVKKLYDKHQALKPIAALTGKSLPWVSKHLAAATKLSWRARMLLDSGKTEDLDLVLTISQIETLAWGRPQQQLLDAIETGKAGRTEARALLAEIKEKIAAEKKASAKKKAKAKNAPVTEQKTPSWTASHGFDDLIDELKPSENVDLDAVIGKLTAEQQQVMCEYVVEAWQSGHQLVTATKLDAMRRIARWIDNYPSTEDTAAYILGANNIDLTLRDLAIEIRATIV
ncbi:ParB/RepB/Spo0J family partition protein [Variovorax sp. CAN2819]|uniref:ParB/RepB/Spo0J family partition protein n=1 Tax=Variovorax sp. CAN15 TaxID=3046727 RepID=UPI00264A10C0|nr:ParB/RepB/Spo0J family partition protein [Variovorax sp. CAN15]MDN6886495.1 ParB/RepB/Spo0J family partition protein [Variovorax sp. CAN15]